MNHPKSSQHVSVSDAVANAPVSTGAPCNAGACDELLAALSEPAKPFAGCTSQLVPEGGGFAWQGMSQNDLRATIPSGAVVQWKFVWGVVADGTNEAGPSYDLSLTVEAEHTVAEVLDYLWALYKQAIGSGVVRRNSYGLEAIDITRDGFEFRFGT